MSIKKINSFQQKGKRYCRHRFNHETKYLYKTPIYYESFINMIGGKLVTKGFGFRTFVLNDILYGFTANYTVTAIDYSYMDMYINPNMRTKNEITLYAETLEDLTMLRLSLP